ncbi:MAG: alanine--tRNA ligase [Planctomycetota bacterium]|nr:alanine--tRNA ligase [Planctomycetota bacterium]MDI6787897.1 alanine--tRNA ligase [Planctomycetota bacterium]
MRVDEVRSLFLEFFKEKGHRIYPSDSLVPNIPDPSLLFTGAGMNQFKNYFLGSATPLSLRVASSQKCLRTVDIERVGRTFSHHTFFEMLGNFSFGDYFKREAILFAWEFLTKWLKISPEKLIVTVFEDDKTAYNIWRDEIEMPEDKLFSFGEDTNYWPANAPSDGPNGPCGPCSEIYYDFGKEYGCGLPTCSVDCDCNRFVEVWNLVFMEFDRQDKGKLVPLKKKNIDTGMGLERISAVMQNVVSNFDIDVFKIIIKHIVNLVKIEYVPSSEEGTRVKRIADHSRALTFLIADGVSPSNEGRGYVERRILRRAVRDGMNLGMEKPFLYKVVPVVCEVMGKAYPELKDKHIHIARVIKAEEEKFLETVESGMKMLEETIKGLKDSGTKIFPGESAFKLYDTYGFPVDLTESILHEKGFKLDISEYEKALSEQKAMSRAGSKIASEIFNTSEIDEIRNILAETKYLGDETLSAEVTLEGIILKGKLTPRYPEENFLPLEDEIVIITDHSPFYPESGGQCADTGYLKTDDTIFEVTDTQKAEKYILHIGKLKQGCLKTGMKIKAEVSPERREMIAANHTATHLLHYALRSILGPTVEQSGSLVLSDRLRFDYSMSQPPSEHEIRAIEELVNQRIRENANVSARTMGLEQAKKMGATALFSEKYADTVRVLSIGDYSKELCGGSHIKQTGEIGYFRIISDASISSGIRRIEALTGREALKKTYELERILDQSASLLQTTIHQVPHKIKQLSERLEQTQMQLANYHKEENRQIADALLERAIHIPIAQAGLKLITEIVEGKTIEDLRLIADHIRNRGETVIALLATARDNKANMLLMLTPRLCSDDFNAVSLIKEIAPIIEGSGGGRKDLAQAGGKRADKLTDALTHFANLIKSRIGGIKRG